MFFAITLTILSKTSLSDVGFHDKIKKISKHFTSQDHEKPNRRNHPSFSESKSFERGREYYRSEAIYNAVRQGNSLLADCEGSYTYHLRVELDEGGIQSASCSYPYEYAGYCKNIVALLLTYIHKPDEFTERKSLAALLENVDQAALVTILAKLADRHPELYNWLETSLPPVAVVAVKSAESSPRRESPVSEQAYRKRIKNILRAGS